jgi:uncharacterized membrane protein YgcG
MNTPLSGFLALAVLCGSGMLYGLPAQAADAPSPKATPPRNGAARIAPPRAQSSVKPQVNGALLEFQIPEKVVTSDTGSGKQNQRTVATPRTSAMTQENTGDCVKNAGDGCKPKPKASPKDAGSDGKGGRRRNGEGGGESSGQGGAPAPGGSGDCQARNMTQENTGCE